LRPRFALRKTRSVHVAIATIMLAVPASAYALTGPVSDTNANPVLAGAHTGLVQPSTSASHAAAAARVEVNRRSNNVLAGSPVVIQGNVVPAQARRWVRLQGHFADGWQTLAKGRTGSHGGFKLRPQAISGLRRRLRVSLMGPGNRARSTVPAGLLTVYTESVASWYHDAGNTACGFHAGLGVANRSLPCGTKVRVRYGGHSVTATVDDRGPYVGGRDWDLNQSTAAALGFGGVGTVWVSQ
jgi:peptidoglycan lytic transglycosylase